MAKIVKKPSERRSEIIKASRHLFQVNGYEKVTMQNVMDRLGIAKGTIYHYFKSKEEILEVVVEEIVCEHLDKMQRLIQETKGDALQKMRVLIEAGRDVSEPSLLDALHKTGNEAMHTRLLVATLMKQAPLYAQLIEQGCEDGIFQSDFPLECAEFILSAVQFLTDMGIHQWKKEDIERRSKAFPQLIEQQLQAPAGSFQFMVI